MTNRRGASEQTNPRIADWLIAVLRFAVTREECDRSTVLAMAREMDRPRPGATAFAFFSRTSDELCATIAAKEDSQRTALLRRHFNRVGNPQLRAALEAATGLRDADTAAHPARSAARAYLWKGL